MLSEVIAVFGEYIKACRVKAGLSQQKLGEMCGYTGHTAQTVVQNWEYNKQPVPLEKIRILAASLDIPIDSLIP